MFPSPRSLAQRLQSRLTRQIVRDPGALAIVLRSLRDAEAGGEAVVFNEPITIVSPRLQRLIARHAADEDGHLALLDEALRQAGADEEGEGHVQVLGVVEQNVGDVFERDLDQPENLAAAYWLIHALERRLASFLGNLLPHLEEVNPELAKTLARIKADEERHITWCQVVTWEVQGGERQAWEAVRDEMIALEARGFGQVQAANLKLMLRTALPDMGWAEKAMWWAAANVLEWSRMPLPVGDPEGALAARAWEPEAGLRAAA